jgi:hypothetical protein
MAGKATLQILRVVKEPLGFFVLALLVLEATFLAIGAQTGPDKTFLFVLNLASIISLVLIVAVLTYLGVLGKGGSETLPSYSVFLEAPEKLQRLDLNRIVWDENNCTIRIGKKTLKCVPTSPFDTRGDVLEITIASDHFPRDVSSSVTLTLTDQFGHRWDPIKFRLWQRNLKLQPRSDWTKIRQDYSEEDAR